MVESQLQVIIVDDSQADRFVIEDLIRGTGIASQIITIDNSGDAIRMINQAVNGEIPIPDLMLLDINLPMHNGHEILALIRNKVKLARLCVIMCTGSNSPDDLIKAHSNHANGYFVKPMNIKEMDEIQSHLKTVLSDLSNGDTISLPY